MLESARHTVVKSGCEPRSSRHTIHPSESRPDSTELLRQLSDVVDGLVRLSTRQKDQSLNMVNVSGWTILDHAQKFLSVTGSSREIPERALFSK